MIKIKSQSNGIEHIYINVDKQHRSTTTRLLTGACYDFFKSDITPVLGEENFSLKIHLEYGDTFTKLFMHVSSRNMFPTTRNMGSVVELVIKLII